MKRKRIHDDKPIKYNNKWVLTTVMCKAKYKQKTMEEKWNPSLNSASRSRK